ncbi:hypothetical protein F444_17641 [Phytophthora nicotianae P1976]|uniref:Uncharacterized protein n=1 Tax=Phytophthora nicotianae P1976 TaxID=1317066 RepID=A0A080ZEC1_PHYNI|nr:hypothetical protein F444_17641 [Phytophthora nicotianae P1976]
MLESGKFWGNTTARATKYVHIRALARFVDWLYGHTDDSHRVVLFTRSFLELEQINNDHKWSKAVMNAFREGKEPFSFSMQTSSRRCIGRKME